MSETTIAQTVAECPQMSPRCKVQPAFEAAIPKRKENEMPVAFYVDDMLTFWICCFNKTILLKLISIISFHSVNAASEIF